MFAESLLEEPTTEDCWPDDRRGIRDKKREHERWSDCEGPAVGYRGAGEVPSHHRRSLQKGARLLDRIRCNEPQNFQQRQILALVLAGLGGARHLHHARRKQSRSRRRGPPCETSNSVGGATAVQLAPRHEVC